LLATANRMPQGIIDKLCRAMLGKQSAKSAVQIEQREFRLEEMKSAHSGMQTRSNLASGAPGSLAGSDRQDFGQALLPVGKGPGQLPADHQPCDLTRLSKGQGKVNFV